MLSATAKAILSGLQEQLVRQQLAGSRSRRRPNPDHPSRSAWTVVIFVVESGDPGNEMLSFSIHKTAPLAAPSAKSRPCGSAWPRMSSARDSCLTGFFWVLVVTESVTKWPRSCDQMLFSRAQRGKKALYVLPGT